MRERPSAGCIPADIPENSRYLTYLLSIPDKGTPDKELGKLLLNINVQYFSDIIGETAGLSSGYLYQT